MSNAAQTLLRKIRQPAVDRTEHFMSRVYEHLGRLPDDQARHTFLADQLERWQYRYTAWAARIDDGTATPTDLRQTAFDYIETITALRKAKAALTKESADA